MNGLNDHQLMFFPLELLISASLRHVLEDILNSFKLSFQLVHGAKSFGWIFLQALE